MFHNRGNWHDYSRVDNDINEITEWCTLLKITPAEFFQIPETELALRLSHVKKKLQLKAAKKLIKYQEKEIYDLKRLIQAKRRNSLAFYPDPGQIYKQERMDAGGHDVCGITEEFTDDYDNDVDDEVDDDDKEFEDDDNNNEKEKNCFPGLPFAIKTINDLGDVCTYLKTLKEGKNENEMKLYNKFKKPLLNSSKPVINSVYTLPMMNKTSESIRLANTTPPATCLFGNRKTLNVTAPTAYPNPANASFSPGSSSPPNQSFIGSPPTNRRILSGTVPNVYLTQSRFGNASFTGGSTTTTATFSAPHPGLSKNRLFTVFNTTEPTVYPTFNIPKSSLNTTIPQTNSNNTSSKSIYTSEAINRNGLQCSRNLRNRTTTLITSSSNQTYNQPFRNLNDSSNPSLHPTDESISPITATFNSKFDPNQLTDDSFSLPHRTFNSTPYSTQSNTLPPPKSHRTNNSTLNSIFSRSPDLKFNSTFKSTSSSNQSCSPLFPHPNRTPDSTLNSTLNSNQSHSCSLPESDRKINSTFDENQSQSLKISENGSIPQPNHKLNTTFDSTSYQSGGISDSNTATAKTTSNQNNTSPEVQPPSISVPAQKEKERES